MSASTVPGIIAWPLIAFMTLVLLGRYRWCNSNLYEKYFNTTLALMLLAQLLREHLVQGLLVRTVFMTLPGTWQLGTAVLSYSYSEFIGFTLLWSGLSEAETRRRHKYYRLAGMLLAVGLLVFGTPARMAGQSLEFTVGWNSVTTVTCFIAMPMVLVTRVIWNSVRELRIADRRRERLIAISTLAMGLTAVVTALHEAALQISDELGWTHTADFRQQFHASCFFYMIFSLFVIAPVPLAMKLRHYLGLDHISRSWRELQPLRQAMRVVAPECVFEPADDEPGRQKTELQLHQTVVEIRDAILGLRPYFRATPGDDLMHFLAEPHKAPARDRNAAISALRLAYAARAKAAGVAPKAADVDSTSIVASRAATLRQEAAELTMLAKWWPAAYAATEKITESAAETKVSSTELIDEVN
ncbi:hypothetical protein B8W69_13290 [Mycobacterium vulneris]|uniref:DUF6545 domain-containing protein n=1 Tax=Mycolicibacterium vulneris TaxID=547163 RepID=A0A1X2L0Z1_9MYCO|nr:DUF6545 domain-containing protein [Mycolicibacterium vulneris]OSC27651.1 hypothetical protein B8W69_13290 [Mycolicibacterium vulneris]